VTLPDGVAVEDVEWKQMSDESMDLLGGDMELIRQQLELLSHVFRSEQYGRIPRANSTVQESEDIVKVKAF
jgi:hypothetical protein